MAKRRGQTRGGSGRAPSGTAGGAGKVLLGFVLGGAAVAGAGYLYLHTGQGAGLAGGEGRAAEPAGAPASAERSPARAAGSPEQAAAPGRGAGGGGVSGPTAAAGGVAAASGVAEPPFGASEEVFEAAAGTYGERCASCHGTPRHDAHGAPAGSQQIFGRDRAAVSARAPGELFAAIRQGAPGKGMPRYAGALTDPQIWQLALLLRSADQPLPDPVSAILNRKRP